MPWGSILKLCQVGSWLNHIFFKYNGNWKTQERRLIALSLFYFTSYIIPWNSLATSGNEMKLVVQPKFAHETSWLDKTQNHLGLVSVDSKQKASLCILIIRVGPIIKSHMNGVAESENYIFDLHILLLPLRDNSSSLFTLCHGTVVKSSDLTCPDGEKSSLYSTLNVCLSPSRYCWQYSNLVPSVSHSAHEDY